MSEGLKVSLKMKQPDLLFTVSLVLGGIVEKIFVYTALS